MIHKTKALQMLNQNLHVTTAGAQIIIYACNIQDKVKLYVEKEKKKKTLRKEKLLG